MSSLLRRSRPTAVLCMLLAGLVCCRHGQSAPQNNAATQPPAGRYTCYAGSMSVLANGMGYNPMTIHTAGFNGYFFILDRTHYAGNDQKDQGTYTMNGKDLIAHTGPYQRNPANIHYLADGQYHRPTIYVQWLDDKGKPMSAGMICTHD